MYVYLQSRCAPGICWLVDFTRSCDLCSVTYHSIYSPQFEELSHQFSRSLCISCTIWVELISDVHFLRPQEQSIPCMDVIYYGNTFLLMQSQANKRCQQKMQCYYIILFMQWLLHFYQSNSITGQGNVNVCFLLMQFRVWDDPALDYYSS